MVPFALVLLLVSCAGGSKSSQQTVSAAGATGGTSPTAPRPSTTHVGTNAKHKTKKRNGRSGGSSGSAPSSPSSSAPSKNVRLRKLRRKAAAPQKQLNRQRKKRGGGVPAAPKPAAQPGATPQEVLARKARRVCGSIGIKALARRYKVAPTAETVATAYAASYPPTFRAAVHDGCRSAFPGR